jgi:hypothetical protein
MEFRKFEVAEADAVENAEGNTVKARRRGAAPEARLDGSAGIEARGMHGEGDRGTWEVLSSSSRKRRNRGVS